MKRLLKLGRNDNNLSEQRQGASHSRRLSFYFLSFILRRKTTIDAGMESSQTLFARVLRLSGWIVVGARNTSRSHNEGHGSQIYIWSILNLKKGVTGNVERYSDETYLLAEMHHGSFFARLASSQKMKVLCMDLFRDSGLGSRASS